MTSVRLEIPLSELFDFQNGRGFRKTEWRKSGLPIIRIQNLNDPDASFNYFQGDYDPSIFVSKGDLLYSWSGSVGTSFGPHLWQGRDGLLNQHIFKLELKRPINKNYAYYMLRHLTSEIEQSVNGAVGLVHVSKRKLMGFEIPVPSLAEQQRIVAKLDEVDADLRTLSKRLEVELLQSAQIRMSALGEVFSRHPRRDAQEGCLVSTGWPVQRLGTVATVSAGNSAPQDKSLFAGGTHTFIRTSDVGQIRVGEIRDSADKLNDLGVRGMRKFREGVTLVPKSGASTFNNHRVITAVEATVSSHLAVVDARHGVLDDRFVYYFLQTVRAQDLIGDQSYPSLNLTHLESVEIPVPPLAEQQRIVAKLDEIDSLCAAVSENIKRRKTKAGELRQSVLAAAFRGDL